MSEEEHKSQEAATFFYFLLLILPWKSAGQGLRHLLVFSHQQSSLAWMHTIMIQWPLDNGGWMTIYRNSGLGCHGGERKNKRLILKIRLRPNLKETHTENFLSFWWVKTKPWNMIRGEKPNQNKKFVFQMTKTQQNKKRATFSFWDLVSHFPQFTERVSHEPYFAWSIMFSFSIFGGIQASLT